MPVDRNATPVFAELLERLREQGFPIGVDHYVRLHVLLDRLAGSGTPEQVKTLLCPVIATSHEQQEQFYATFEQWAASWSAVVDAEPGRAELRDTEDSGAQRAVDRVKTAADTIRRQWRRSALAALALLIVLGGVSMLLCYAPSRIPRARGVESRLPGTVPDAIRQGTAHSPSWPLYLIAVTAPLLVFAVGEIVRYRRRQIALHRTLSAPPPFVWPLRVPPAANPYARNEVLRVTARDFRQPETAETMSLDIMSSIAATIGALGAPRLRFRSGSRAPEYLLLVERTAARDHQAALFTTLHAALEQEGVVVDRYVFDRDPRVCFRAPGETGVRIDELRRKSSSRRLLVFGTGDSLLDPISGRLRSWVPSLLGWPARVLCTPVPVATWGLRELSLARHFVVLPATVAALRKAHRAYEAERWLEGETLSDKLAEGVRPSRRRDETAAADALGVLRFDEAPDEVARVLRDVLTPDVYQWLCACALYPELHWDLTLSLGTLSSRSGSLVTEESLLNLIQIPWFRTGSIPGPMRTRLLADLAPDLATTGRRAIVYLLERNPPPASSVAAAEYQLELAVQRSALFPPSRPVPQPQTPERVITAPAPRERAWIRLLEHVPSAGSALLLPARLRRMFFDGDIPTLGTHARRRFALAAATCVMLTVAADITRRGRHGTDPVNQLPVGAIPVSAPVAAPPPTPVDTAVAFAPSPTPAAGPPGRPAALLVLGAPLDGNVVAGDSVRLRARVNDARGTRLVNATIQWASSDPEHVTFRNGWAVGIAPGGPAVITATAGPLVRGVSLVVTPRTVVAHAEVALARPTSVEVRTEVRHFVTALEAQDIPEISRRLMPRAVDGSPSREFVAWFEGTQGVTADSLALGEPSDEGIRARVAFRVLLRWSAGGGSLGAQGRKSVTFWMTLTHDDTGWHGGEVLLGNRVAP